MLGCGYSTSNPVALSLTIIAEFPRVGRILSKREFLQIGIRFRQQAENEHSGACRVEMCHCFRRVRLWVSRWVDNYNGKRYDEHPHRLFLEMKEDNQNLDRSLALLFLTWNVQNTANRMTFFLLSSNCLSRPIFTIRYSRYADSRAPHTQTNTVTISCLES